MSRSDLPGSLLQRLAERFAPPAARDRVLLPIVADLQHEWRGASNAGRRLLVRLRGTCAFARALAPLLLRTAAGQLWRGVWIWRPEDGRAARRLLSRVGLATAAVTGLILLDVMRWPVQHGMMATAPLLLPSVLSVALPIACLLGVALSAPRRPPTATPWRPLLGLALVIGLATFLVVGWITPHANRAYRQRVFQAVAPSASGHLALGDRELTFPDLRARRIELIRAGRPQEADRLAVEWHKKPAMAAACLPLALAGVALARAFRRHFVRLLAALCLVEIQYALLRLGEQAADTGRLSPALAMWGPALAVPALAALLILTRGRRPEHASC